MNPCSKRFFFRTTIILHMLAGMAAGARAQPSSNWQSWNDYDMVYPFANAYSFDAELSYQTLLSDQGKWRSVGMTPTLEWSATQHVDLIFAVPLSYTWQTDALNSAEVRLSFGTRFHFTPHRRILTRMLVRYEPRFVYQQLDEEEVGWQKSDRLRLRGEMIIPVNRKTYFENKLFYVLTDFEKFFVKDNEVDERFANRWRYRAGVGYRFSYSYRLEIIYTLQRSRNTLDDDYHTTDNIVRIRFKHFLNKSKPTKKDGSGN